VEHVPSRLIGPCQKVQINDAHKPLPYRKFV
jgi:hypothetical protein